MAYCPSCQRPAAAARATCLYCGAPLPAESPAGDLAAEPAAGGAEPPDTPGGRERSLVILDLGEASADTVARALDLSGYEAGLVTRRRGLLFHRILDHASAEAEARRLAAQGLIVFLTPEWEARARPLRALGGQRSEGTLALRTEEGPLSVRRGKLLLVVRGPITRAYQPASRQRRIDTARLDEGYRLHLHPRVRFRDDLPARDEVRPVEIDAATFEFGFAVTGSARLEADAWAEEVAGGAPCDDEFRRLPPALGPAEPEPRGALAAASSLRLSTGTQGHGNGERPMILDNVQQFRFYSGWRAAVERRRPRS